MGYTHLEPGVEFEIVDRTYGGSGNIDISELVKLPPNELMTREQASVEQEKAIYDKMLNVGKEWLQQAQETTAMRKALAYLRTMPVSHTSNKWVKGEYGTHEMSNMVYKFTYRVYENTRWDKAAQKSIPISWEVSWYLFYNTPNKADYSGNGRQIAGQDRKRFGSKADMDKYIQGRMKAYAHLFTEISPPIPADHVKRFCVNGVLLPGYTIEEVVTPDKETVDSLLSLLDDDDLADGPPTIQNGQTELRERPVPPSQNKPALKRTAHKKKQTAPTR